MDLHQGWPGAAIAMKVDATDAKRKQLQEWAKGQEGGGGGGSWRTSELELDDAANSSRGEEMVAGMEEKDK